MAEKALKEVRFTKASDIMTKNVVYIDGSATAADAIKLMREKKVSSLIVNRREVYDAYGIVTRKDVVSKLVDPGRRPTEVKVHEIMSKPLVTVSPNMWAKYCARVMSKAGVRRAPVFDGKEIIGLLSNTDIFNAIKV